MFLSTDNLTKNKVAFTPHRTFFSDKDRKIRFADIEAFYVDSSEHYFNSSYEGHEYILNLKLKGEEDLYKLEASTPRKDSYKLIQAIHDAIQAHMEKRIFKAHDNGREVSFPTQNDKYRITIGPDQVAVTRLGRKETTFKVEEIYKLRDRHCFEFRGEKNKAVIPIAYISNAWLCFNLAGKQVPRLLEPESKIKKTLGKWFYGLVALAGLNGWFKLIDAGEVFNGICTLAGILLGASLIIAPVLMLVDKLNARRKQKEAREFHS